MYEAEGKVTSHTTLSGKSQATWASVAVIFDTLALDDINTLHIISDSPTSHYGNAYNVYVWKKPRSDLIWVFTELGHGKGPMG